MAAGEGELALGFCAMGAVRLLLFPAATADPDVCGPVPDSLMVPNLMFGTPREEPFGIVAMEDLRLWCPPLKGVEAPLEFPLLPSVGTAGVIDLPFTGTDVVEADRACCPAAPPETWDGAVLEELAALPPGPDGTFLELSTALAYDVARGAGALVCTAADAD